MNDAPHRNPDFETGCISHTGKVRTANEDNFILRPEIGLWAVADGMGGHENGALASATVVAALEAVGAAGSAPDLLAMLEAGVLKANDDLRAEIDRRGATMGATLVCLLIHQRHFACLWSGDSRIYLIRSGIIAQVSRDHTEVQDMVDRGLLTADEAKRSPRRHIITHAIGVHETPELDLENAESLAGQPAFDLGEREFGAGRDSLSGSRRGKGERGHDSGGEGERTGDGEHGVFPLVWPGHIRR